jgi:uncharacterized membrane protein
MQAYGTTTYLVTSLKQVPRGTEGAVSLEGSLAGFLAAAAFSLCGALAYQVRGIIMTYVVGYLCLDVCFPSRLTCCYGRQLQVVHRSVCLLD